MSIYFIEPYNAYAIKNSKKTPQQIMWESNEQAEQIARILAEQYRDNMNNNNATIAVVSGGSPDSQYAAVESTDIIRITEDNNNRITEDEQTRII